MTVLFILKILLIIFNKNIIHLIRFQYLNNKIEIINQHNKILKQYENIIVSFFDYQFSSFDRLDKIEVFLEKQFYLTFYVTVNQFMFQCAYEFQCFLLSFSCVIISVIFVIIFTSIFIFNRDSSLSLNCCYDDGDGLYDYCEQSFDDLLCFTCCLCWHRFILIIFTSKLRIILNFGSMQIFENL